MKFFYRRKLFISIYLFITICLTPIFGHSSPINQLQNNHLRGNNFILDSKGTLYLLYNDILYYKYNESGDVWDRKAPGIRTVAFDPSNEKIIYIVTTKMSVKKSVDSGNKWITINNGLPNKINIYCIFINPHNNQEVFIGTNNGIYKTTDAGFSWESTTLKGYVKQFQINPLDSLIYYALTEKGLHLSNDAGKTWKRIDDTLPKVLVKGKGRTAKKVPIDVGAFVYANYDMPFLLAFAIENKKVRIFKSENNGTSWLESKSSPNRVTAQYVNDAGIFLGSSKSIYKSIDGLDWEKVDLSNKKTDVGNISGIHKLENDKGLIITSFNGKIIHIDKKLDLIGLNYGVMPHSKILALGHGDINGQRRVYAIVDNSNYTDTENYGLYYSIDNGESWYKNKIYERPYYGGNPRLYISPFDNNEMWILERHSDGRWGKFNTFDGGNTWNEVKKWPFSNNKITDLEFHPKDKNTKYVCAGVNSYGLVRYSITSKATGLKVACTQVKIADDDSNKMLADSNLSTDGGWTWNNIFNNQKKLNSAKKYQLLYFKSNEIVIFVHKWGTYFNNCTGTSYVVSSSDLGVSWKILNSFEKKCVYNAYINPYNKDDLFIVGRDKNAVTVNRSLDGGQTWNVFYTYKITKSDSYDQDKLISSILVTNENDGQSIYIGTKYGLKKTIDGGLNWKTIGGIQ